MRRGWVLLGLLLAACSAQAGSVSWGQLAYQSQSLRGRTVTLDTRLHLEENLISKPVGYSKEGRRVFFLMKDDKFKELQQKCGHVCVLSGTFEIDWAGRITMIDYQFPETE